MRTRLIVAFIVVALLAALASALGGHDLIVPFYPSLGNLIRPALDQPPARVARAGDRPAASGAPCLTGPATAVAFVLAASGLLLATITGLAFAASRRVLRPVRRLARGRAADVGRRPVGPGRAEGPGRARPAGHHVQRAWPAALEDKVGELERMEARARQFAGDVSHELRTPLTAMTAVADILGDGTGPDRRTPRRPRGWSARRSATSTAWWTT